MRRPVFDTGSVFAVGEIGGKGQHVLVGEGVSLRRKVNYCVGMSLWEKAHLPCKRYVIEEGGMLL